MSSAHLLSVQENVPLADLTTIGLGGRARFFVECRSPDEIKEAIRFSNQKRLRLQLIGGGSNIVFPDTGFDGIIVKVSPKGLTFKEAGAHVFVEAAAGEEWDPVVHLCLERGLSGIECLSGIPGLVGAVPIQNVGAYGQEVGDAIVTVKAIDLRSLDEVEFSNDDCRFEYRQSRFKKGDRDKYVITRVSFRLTKNGRPQIRYPELQHHIEATARLEEMGDGQEVLRTVRQAVLELRKRKSMVIDSRDEHTRSVGSFFMNPILSNGEWKTVNERWRATGSTEQIPTFPAGRGIKIPAAWLVEHSGFRKGYRKGGVGISANHALALVNYGGTTAELIGLAMEIQEAVRTRFGIGLEPEPVIVE
jgi:UDP-N-acetylmuramate dehydrogenase